MQDKKSAHIPIYTLSSKFGLIQNEMKYLEKIKSANRIF